MKCENCAELAAKVEALMRMVSEICWSGDLRRSWDAHRESIKAAAKAEPPATATIDADDLAMECARRIDPGFPASSNDPNGYWRATIAKVYREMSNAQPPPKSEPPAMKQGVCSGCGRAWADGHGDLCPVKAATAGLMPTPATGEGDGLEAEWSERRNPANGTCNPDVWTDAIAFTREQIAKATAHLHTEIEAAQHRTDQMRGERDAATKERDELRERILTLEGHRAMWIKRCVAMETQRDDLRGKLAKTRGW